ncbi:NUDIX hydrolase [Lacihabitans soyangensis]|uniref:NUDIX domain-containing protein n=1 Tax=Lacihabitans soyangensis TaxID=869394 RepID=A0AAE3H3R4_9BACT|nr:NUDIX domain-containing protein [Lacihabitans soyangensis]MCP9762360.1 NUDIX domain-containing protein [Lacihabitans soyangensis]
MEGLKKVAVICILKHQDKFLLLERLKEPNKDLFTPLGGKLDPFETPLDAAKRETWEESGIHVEDMDFCGILTETSPTKYNWTSYVYIAEIDYQDAPECNEGTLKWINADEILNIPTPITDWHIYDYALKKQKFIFDAVYDEELVLLRMDELIENKNIC